MYWVISYDISKNKYRRRVEAVCKKYGDRVQKSVFEILGNERHINELFDKLKLYVRSKRDHIRCWRICAACFEKVYVSGIGPDIEPEKDIIII